MILITRLIHADSFQQLIQIALDVVKDALKYSKVLTRRNAAVRNILTLPKALKRIFSLFLSFLLLYLYQRDKSLQKKSVPYSHMVLDWVDRLQCVGAGHDPEPLWDDVMWCALRCWYTHRPVEIPGPQSFLHSSLHVVQEHGFGPPPPPQDIAKPRVLARSNMRKTWRSSIMAVHSTFGEVKWLDLSLFTSV